MVCQERFRPLPSGRRLYIIEYSSVGFTVFFYISYIGDKITLDLVLVKYPLNCFFVILCYSICVTVVYIAYFTKLIVLAYFIFNNGTYLFCIVHY